VKLFALLVSALLALAPYAPPAQAPARAERSVPFQVGETLTYDVSWSNYLVAGTATTTVKEKRPSFDSTAYYVVVEARPVPLVSRLYSLYYKLDTLIDAYTLLPQRASVYTEEGPRRHLTTTRFEHLAGRALVEIQSATTVKSAIPIAATTQDAVSALYLLRALPLQAGLHLTLPVTNDGVNYTTTVDVAGPQRVRTPLGDRSAWRVTFAVADDHAQAVGKNLAIWIADDAQRLPLRLQADLAVGGFVLMLRDAH
jgi:hypothetical protein